MPFDEGGMKSSQGDLGAVTLSVRQHTEAVSASSLLARHNVGIKEVSNETWLVSFMVDDVVRELMRTQSRFECYCALKAYTVRDLKVSPGRNVVVGNDGLFGESG